MFSVPTRTQYGIRALVHLARRATGNPGEADTEHGVATSADIARAESISPKYLEGILAQLRTAGLVTAARGKHGGYRLAHPASEIRMSRVVASLEGEIRPVECVDGGGGCGMGGGCMPRLFWIGLKEAIDGYLDSKTLLDVITDPGPATGTP
jgi:Rrf2 family protein